MSNLAFQITNDLCFAGVIGDDASVIEVQELVQARLNTDSRFRRTPSVHLAHSDDFMYPGAPWCAQVGNTICSANPDEVTCIKCLNGYGNSILEGPFPRPL